jgi:hypothetical protein
LRWNPTNLSRTNQHHLDGRDKTKQCVRKGHFPPVVPSILCPFLPILFPPLLSFLPRSIQKIPTHQAFGSVSIYLYDGLTGTKNLNARRVSPDGCCNQRRLSTDILVVDHIACLKALDKTKMECDQMGERGARMEQTLAPTNG